MQRHLFILLLIGLLTAGMMSVVAQDEDIEPVDEPPALLTDPFLQLPTENGVYVVWFTEWEGEAHTVTADGEEFEATTTKMTRTAEDDRSWVGEQQGDGAVYPAYTPRDIWRHEAEITGLTRGESVPYVVTSITEDGDAVVSDEFTLQPLPEEGQPLSILLTSDHQLKAMTPANLQMVEQVAGEGEVDAVFFAGDLQNIPDRASEWFDDNRGWAFFPGLQGNAGYTLERTRTEEDITITTSTTYTTTNDFPTSTNTNTNSRRQFWNFSMLRLSSHRTPHISHIIKFIW